MEEAGISFKVALMDKTNNIDSDYGENDQSYESTFIPRILPLCI